MNEERQNESQRERDSQLSAMFDGELPAAECELLARRLTRDDALRSQWSGYALIGAALRGERGVKLHDRVATRVQSALAQEPTYGESVETGTARPAAASAVAASKGAQRWMRFARPAVGAGIAAGVAAVSIVWLRGQGDPAAADTMLAATTAPQTITLQPEEPATLTMAASPSRVASSTGEAERYSTPAPSSQTSIVPPARLANYVVAHSEYSGPLSRRMALLSVVGSETQIEAAVPAETADSADGSGAPDAP